MEAADPLPGVKALLFDVFGTTVDWRSTVTRHLFQRCQQTLYTADDCTPRATKVKAESMTEEKWGEFAAEWRASYYAYTKSVVKNKVDKPKSIDEHHLDSLRELLQKWDLQGFWNDNTIREISLIWHSLDGWQDSSAGLAQLKKRYVVCTLSNGNVELLSDMAEHASLSWSHILSSAMFGTFKPDPRVYSGAANKLGLRVDECGMVAAHLGDLQAAKAVGFKAVYVERAREEAWQKEEVERASGEGWVDVWVKEELGGFEEVARRLKIS